MACRVCGEAAVTPLLDLGAQPIANRFLSAPGERAVEHPLAVGQCQRCAVIQLLDPAPPDMLRSPFSWISYNEPEGHLDDLVEVVLSLDGIHPDSRVMGVTYKDDTTLERLHRRGMRNQVRLDPATDFGAEAPTAGLETVQARLTPARARDLVGRYGRADVLLVRHIAEHAHAPSVFLAAIRELLAPGGYAVFEVPDCSRALRLCDVTTLWEEHVLYLTPSTLPRLTMYGGFATVATRCYQYSNENSLIAIVQSGTETPSQPTSDELVLGQTFAAGVRERGARVREYLTRVVAEQGAIAMFGAGHLACAFIAAMGVEGLLTFVVDDHPEKRGMYMPGSGLPIVGSDALETEHIQLCLSSLSPESETKVLARQQAYLDRGGRFQSIFPGTQRAMPL